MRPAKPCCWLALNTSSPLKEKMLIKKRNKKLERVDLQKKILLCLLSDQNGQDKLNEKVYSPIKDVFMFVAKPKVGEPLHVTSEKNIC